MLLMCLSKFFSKNLFPDYDGKFCVNQEEKIKTIKDFKPLHLKSFAVAEGSKNSS